MYLFVNTFTLHGLFSAEFQNMDTRVNVKGSVVHALELVDSRHHSSDERLWKDSSNSLDRNHERVPFTIFLSRLKSITREK